MIGARSLVDRLSGRGAETDRPRLPNPFKPNWGKRMKKITEKIADAERDIAKLEDQRADAALRAEAYDDNSEAASVELFEIHQKLNAARQHLADLQAARGAAARKQEEEDAETARKAAEAQRDKIKAAQKKFAKAVQAADSAIETAATELDKAKTFADEIHGHAGQSVVPLVHENVFGRVSESVRFRFRHFGLKPSAFTSAEEATLAQYVPSADALTERARPPIVQREDEEVA